METVRIKTQPTKGNETGEVVINLADLQPGMVVVDKQKVAAKPVKSKNG